MCLQIEDIPWILCNCDVFDSDNVMRMPSGSKRHKGSDDMDHRDRGSHGMK